MRRACSWLGVAAAALWLVGCQGPPAAPVDPSETLAIASVLVEAGQADLAAQLLEHQGLHDQLEGRGLFVDALIMLERFDEASAALANQTLGREDRTRLEDICAIGAIRAIEAGDEATASVRLRPCETSERIDLQMLRVRRDVGMDGELTDGLARDWVIAVSEADEGPERDLAAELVETLLLDRAEAAEDVMDRLNLRRRAFELGQNPELGATLPTEIFDAAQAIMVERPQDAATLLERLYLRQIQGLTVDEALAARARASAEEALFPVFLDHYRSRYANKWQEADVADALYDPESRTFTHPAPADVNTRQQIQRWVYGRIERPVPDPVPSFVELTGVCSASDAACTFTLDDLAGFAYRATELERQFAAQIGVTLQY